MLIKFILQNMPFLRQDELCLESQGFFVPVSNKYANQYCKIRVNSFIIVFLLCVLTY
jgi:hypothetical protein